MKELELIEKFQKDAKKLGRNDNSVEELKMWIKSVNEEEDEEDEEDEEKVAIDESVSWGLSGEMSHGDSSVVDVNLGEESDYPADETFNGTLSEVLDYIKEEFQPTTKNVVVYTRGAMDEDEIESIVKSKGLELSERV